MVVFFTFDRFFANDFKVNVGVTLRFAREYQFILGVDYSLLASSFFFFRIMEIFTLEHLLLHCEIGNIQATMKGRLKLWISYEFSSNSNYQYTIDTNNWTIYLFHFLEFWYGLSVWNFNLFMETNDRCSCVFRFDAANPSHTFILLLLFFN